MKRVRFRIPEGQSLDLAQHFLRPKSTDKFKNCGTLDQQDMTYFVFEHDEYGPVASAELSPLREVSLAQYFFDKHGINLEGHPVWELSRIRFRPPKDLPQDKAVDMRKSFLSELYKDIQVFAEEEMIRFIITVTPLRKTKFNWPFIIQSDVSICENEKFKMNLGLLGFNDSEPHILKVLKTYQNPILIKTSK